MGKHSFWYRYFQEQLRRLSYIITLSMPKRQQHLYVYTISKVTKGFSYSLGYVFRNQLRQLKFYKRTLRSIGSFIAYLKKFILKKICIVIVYLLKIFSIGSIFF